MPLPICTDITVEGNPTVDQRAYVILTDVETVAGVEFGILYTPSTQVLGWTPCVSGLTHGPDWPAPESGIAIVLNETYDDGGMLVVGYFDIPAGSVGVLAMSPIRAPTGRSSWTGRR